MAPLVLALVWLAPTLCSDGTPIDQCALTHYTLYQGLSGQPKVSVATIDPTATRTTVSLTPGTWCFQISASSVSAESDLSNESCQVIVGVVPQAPTVTLSL